MSNEIREDGVNNLLLKKIQKIQIEMLIEVDRICKKNNISYNIIAGTLLGAVRHCGYIPWDDDADVALLREEYDKFVRACKQDLDKTRFIFQDFTVTEGYRWGYGKLRRKGTRVVRKGQEHMQYHSGVFIDIFPLDFVPDQKIKRLVWTFQCFFVRKILWSKVGRRIEKNYFKRALYIILSLIPEKNVLLFLQSMIDYGKGRTSSLVRILTFPPPKGKFGYYRRWYESSSQYKFENIVLDGINHYDAYLSYKYGNYMDLPPLDQRKVHPFSECNLEYVEEEE